MLNHFLYSFVQWSVFCRENLFMLAWCPPFRRVGLVLQATATQPPHICLCTILLVYTCWIAFSYFRLSFCTTFIPFPPSSFCSLCWWIASNVAFSCPCHNGAQGFRPFILLCAICGIHWKKSRSLAWPGHCFVGVRKTKADVEWHDWRKMKEERRVEFNLFGLERSKERVWMTGVRMKLRKGLGSLRDSD